MDEILGSLLEKRLICCVALRSVNAHVRKKYAPLPGPCALCL